MAAYKEQLERIRRFLGRIELYDRPYDEYEDDIWSFFQNCWHLKDWLKNDDELTVLQRDSVESRVAASPNLMVCADLANARKHLKLTSPRVGANHSHKNFLIVIGGPSKVEYFINMGTGAKVEGLQLAHACLAEWEQILNDMGLKT
jgi:hypothetical protein